VRIVYVIDGILTDMAGTESQLLKLIRGQQGRNQVELVSLSRSAWLEANAAALPCGVHVFDLKQAPRGRIPGEFLRLVRTLHALRPDLVHTYFPVGNILGVFAARLAGVRHVVSSRRDLGIWMNPRYLAATRLANRCVRRIIVNSKEVKELTERAERFPAERIEVVYNGVDLDGFRRGAPDPALRAALGLRPDSRVVGQVGNFRPVKGQRTLVQAAQQVLRTRDDIDFLFVGGSSDQAAVQYRDETRALAQALGVAHRVHFADGTRSVAAILRLFDIGLNCSEHEGLSNAIIEYMAAQVPCIVTAAGGNLDLVEHGVNGLTYPYGDAAALSDRILRLLDRPDEAARFAEAALDRVRRLMSLEAMIARTLGIYQQLTPAAGVVGAPHPGV
jgi:glycosyltransferase involved in cell wall biosynthesis